MSAGEGRGMIRTTCPYCGVGCGLQVAPDGTVAGDPDHPANFGRLCSKGAALGETLEKQRTRKWNKRIRLGRTTGIPISLPSCLTGYGRTA